MDNRTIDNHPPRIIDIGTLRGRESESISVGRGAGKTGRARVARRPGRIGRTRLEKVVRRGRERRLTETLHQRRGWRRRRRRWCRWLSLSFSLGHGGGDSGLRLRSRLLACRLLTLTSLRLLLAARLSSRGRGTSTRLVCGRRRGRLGVVGAQAFRNLLRSARGWRGTRS